ncbi:hypothetical protein Tco_1461668 [Tanacetum coccineum]
MDNTNSPPPPEVPTSILFEKVLKLNSILESLNLIPLSRCSRVVYKKERDSDVMLIELIKNNDCPGNEELEEDDDVLEEEEFRGDHFDKFPSRSELAYHKHNEVVKHSKLVKQSQVVKRKEIVKVRKVMKWEFVDIVKRTLVFGAQGVE